MPIIARKDSEFLTGILELLSRLVAFDTENPPRRIQQDGIFAFLRAALGPAFSCSVKDLGDGCVSLLAVRGSPRLLFNVHIDTVPAGDGWTTDPRSLVVADGRAIGRGACDIKGAAACLISAAQRTRGDAALLFTSDEEAGSSRCVKDFVAGGHRFAGVVVGEPTGCRAVTEHRGIATSRGVFQGTMGHASSPRALADSALHEAVRWASRAIAFAEQSEATHYKGLAGIRFNLGVLSGGTKPNMIASSAELRFGVRPLPNQVPDDLLRTIQALAPSRERATWEHGFVAPPLSGPADIARTLGMPEGAPVDYWTEAALFADSGIPSIVYGPGDIAQAHTIGEWVRISDLVEAEAAYGRILAGSL